MAELRPLQLRAAQREWAARWSTGRMLRVTPRRGGHMQTQESTHAHFVQSDD